MIAKTALVRPPASNNCLNDAILEIIQSFLGGEFEGHFVHVLNLYECLEVTKSNNKHPKYM